MSKDESNGKPEKERRPRRKILPLWSFLLLVCSTLLHAFHNDQTYILWAWPSFIVLPFAFILTVRACARKLLLLILWSSYVAFMVPETKYFARLATPAKSGQLKFISLNCAGGTVEAVLELKDEQPDLILLQESPNGLDLKRLTNELYGSEGAFVRGPDASIIAKGQLKSVEPKKLPNATAAIWTYGGVARKVLSMRLTPPVMRIDLYNPGSWHEFAQNRVARRAEVAELATLLTNAKFEPEIIGGDFNTPPDAETLAPLVAGMTDAFDAVGKGYGATCVSPYPLMVRIDYIWTSALNPVFAQTKYVSNSDHRALVVNLD